MLRLGLMVGLPAVLAVAAVIVWLFTGGVATTDNAYVKAPIVAVAPEVSGRVIAIMVAENQAVRAGQTLLRIDDRPFRIAVARAEADLDAARSDIRELQAAYAEKQAELTLARSTLDYASRELSRRSKLANRQVVSQSGLDEARESAEAARQRIVILQRELARIVTRLGGEPPIEIDTQPSVRAAQATLDQARLDLARSLVTAPANGIVAKLPDPGDTVSAGVPAFSLIGTDDVWIEANFKETELTWMRPGQPVEIKVDTYPGRVFPGRVASIAQATGAEFSVLPPQNASGNWIKVVQRVPVRIALDLDSDAPPLRAGMSSEVEVVTGHGHVVPAPLKAVAGWFGVRPVQAAQ
jgi:membrane fusion protein (multidrug efflux system)